MDYLIQLDHLLFLLINQNLTSALQDLVFPILTDLHKQLWFQLIAYPALIAAFVIKYKKKGILYFLFFALTIATTDLTGSKIVKKSVDRPRPFETSGLQVTQRSKAHGRSFISNHAANMFALATYTSAFFPPARYVLFATATLIAYSRVYNGVHFPLDVICGAMWGVGIALIYIQIAKRLGEKLKT